LIAALVFFVATGCGVFRHSGGQMEVVGINDSPARLSGDLKTAIYRYRDTNTATFVFSDLPLDDLKSGRFSDGRIICVDMTWRPKAGSTPVDRTATNCTVRHVILTGDAAGIYDGAGFLAPSEKSGAQSFGGSISGAVLRLTKSTDGFHDVLGTAELNGSFNASRDDGAVDQVAVRLNTEVSRRLGSLFYVLGY
jgi:hypothetical protein